MIPHLNHIQPLLKVPENMQKTHATIYLFLNPLSDRNKKFCEKKFSALPTHLYLYKHIYTYLQQKLLRLENNFKIAIQKLNRIKISAIKL